MDLRHIGSEGELVCCSTPCLNVTIKGAEDAPPLARCEEKASTLKIVCDQDCDVSLSGEAEMDCLPYHGNTYSAIFRSRPLFFEQRAYELIVEPIDGHVVEFWHENYHVRKAITSVGRSHVLSGILNFRNDIGLSELVFVVDGRRYLTITIEVFPSKIDYQEDYKAIVADVTKEVYNLVFDFLRRTYQSLHIAPSAKPSPVEFFTIIRSIYKEFIAAADMVLRCPHHLLQQENEIMPQHKIRRYDEKTIRWLEKHPEQMARDKNGILVDKALAVRKYVTYDTRENRLTKYMLEQTARRLDQFRIRYLENGPDPDAAILQEARNMVVGIQRRCNTGFMKEVTSEASGAGMSLVFGMAPGYQQLYRCYLLLQHGLAVTGGIFNISIKDLAVLYEYWCFIKLNSLMKEKYELLSQDIIRVDGTGLSVSLVKGSPSHVRYRNKKTDEEISLSYNPTISKIPTIAQKPDNVLKLEKKGAEIDYEYVFDAKYRINPSIEGSEYHTSISKTPGPEVEDINTMHRYRDAIVYHHGSSLFEHMMYGAYVLFPYKDEDEYRNHRFFKSIDKVNIGGLPFLPSATNMVTEMLDELISDSPQSAFERAILPKGVESKLKKVDWSRRDVLIGAIRSKEQMADCLDHNRYYLPIRMLSEESMPIREVALYQPRSLFGIKAGIEYYGEVLSIEKVERSNLEDNPFVSESPYYVLKIKKWIPLDRRIEVKEFGIQSIAFTNHFLLKHCTQVSELLIKSEEAYRFLVELKRRVNDAMLINDDNVVGFEFEGYKVKFEDGEIRLYGNSGRVEYYCKINDFVHKPNAQLRNMMRAICL